MVDKTGVYVLEKGENAIISRAWLTDKAEATIDIQYFIFSYDNIGTIACDYLLRAADRGVKVRVIIDDVMLHVNPDFLLAIDQHPNIDFKIYNPNITLGKNLLTKLKNVATDFRGINQRMHNKTFVVDGQYVITGGRNIADEYFDYDHAYNFRDRDVLLIGKTAKEVQLSFDDFWNHPLSIPVSDVVPFSVPDYDYKQVHKYIQDYACNPKNFWPEIRKEIEDLPFYISQILDSEMLHWVEDVEFISDVPGKNAETKTLGGGGKTTTALMELVSSAKNSIYIQSPYLVTSDLSRNLFKAAVDRGVEIKILTNSLASTDNLEAFSGYYKDRKELLKTGVKIYEYKPAPEVRRKLLGSELQEKLEFQPTFAIHAKSMVVDEATTVIGTFNLDPRSAHLNTECITIIRSEAITTAVKETMIQELLPENAWETTLDFNPDSEGGWKKRWKIFVRRIVPSSIL